MCIRDRYKVALKPLGIILTILLVNTLVRKFPTDINPIFFKCFLNL